MPQPFLRSALQQESQNILPLSDCKHLDTEIHVPAPSVLFRAGRLRRRPQACLDSGDTELSLR